jgi:hypothetical protein
VPTGSGGGGEERGVGTGAERDATFDDELEALGFTVQGSSRRGGRMWALPFNRYLLFTLHDYHDTIVLTWSFLLGEYVLERGWQVGASETSSAELYPQHDVRLPLDVEAVGAEITRVLTSLRLDLGDPTL